MKNLVIILLVLPIMAFGQKSKTTDTLLIGKWDRDNVSFKNGSWESAEDFFTHIEFNNDFNCVMNNHFGVVYSMTYGLTKAKWKLENNTMVLNDVKKITSDMPDAPNSREEKKDYKLLFKISKDPENKHLLRMEVKDMASGKKYFFYKIAA